MDKYTKLEKRITEVERRNQRVEQDKAWETSWSRRLLLIFFTYLTIAIYMKFVLNTNPWLNAIVPSLGFYLSTLSLPFIKKIWSKYIYKK